MKVFVYFNLHSKVWSVKALEGDHKGLVIAHAQGVALFRVTPRVSEKGRQRVIREQKKNVHAGLVGELGYMVKPTILKNRKFKYHYIENDDTIREVTSKGHKAITYNPYKYSSFVYKDNEQPYKGSDCAFLGRGKVLVGAFGQV